MYRVNKGCSSKNVKIAARIHNYIDKKVVAGLNNLQDTRYIVKTAISSIMDKPEGLLTRGLQNINKQLEPLIAIQRSRNMCTNMITASSKTSQLSTKREIVIKDYFWKLGTPSETQTQETTTWRFLIFTRCVN